MEGEAGLPGKVDGVVEHHDAAMADHAAEFGELLVVEGGVEQAGRPVGAQGAADLHRPHRPAAGGAAAEIHDQLAQGQAEGALDQAATADVAGELDRHGAARATHAVVAIGRGTVGQDPGHAGEADDVVDHGRLAEEARYRRQRRLEADLAAPALQALQQRGLLAADIGACTQAGLEMEGSSAAQHVVAEQAGLVGDMDRPHHLPEGVRIFGADIDEALDSTGGDAGDRHALDQGEGVALHQHPVGEGAAVALVGVANDIFRRALGSGRGPPLDAGRKAGAAAAAQAGAHHLLDRHGRPQRQGPAQPGEAAMRLVVSERQGLDDADPGEAQPLLAGHPGQILDPAEA